MKVTLPLFILILFFMSLTAHSVIGEDLAFGCYMLGAEVNGDYSTEYLYLGQCR